METPNSNNRIQLNETATVPYQRFLDAHSDGVICYQAVRTDGVITGRYSSGSTGAMSIPAPALA